jgi:hypothetical protein
MVPVIMYHSVSWCFGTSLAPRLHSNNADPTTHNLAARRAHVGSSLDNHADMFLHGRLRGFGSPGSHSERHTHAAGYGIDLQHVAWT